MMQGARPETVIVRFAGLGFRKDYWRTASNAAGPILGPLFGLCIFVLVGMLSFESLWWALLPPALYFGIQLVEGETVTPMPLARRFTLNPVLTSCRWCSGSGCGACLARSWPFRCWLS
jgi:hypothetical protein